MLDTLRQHLATRVGQDAPQLEEVLGHFKPLSIPRNTVLLWQGDVCRHVYFIARGCLQVYIHDSSDNETTRDLAMEGQWCSELASFGNQKPASENIRALEDTELLAIHFDSFQTLMQTVPAFGMVYQQLLEASHANSVYRINTMIALSALERIKWLRDNRPSLIKRVSSKVVASYLGISQETYSRLKQKL